MHSPWKETTIHFRRSLAVGAAVVLTLVAGCSDPAPEPEPPSQPSPTPEDSPEPTEDPTEDPTEEPTQQVLTEYGVSAGHPLAVDAGAQIMDSGGNAADAIVAAAFAVAVVEPFASGIGGGGSAIVAGPQLDPVAYDYREEVPQHGSVPPSGAGVPGFVAGLAELHSDYGELDWAEVIAPAIELADEGFIVTEFLELRLRSDRGPEAILGQEQFSPGGSTVAAGDTLVQEDLASTMTAIAEDGSEAFYTGALVDEITSVEGLDAESLADYEVVRADPVSGSFGDYELLGPPPALAGAALVQMLQVAEVAGAGESAPGSAAYIEQFSQGWAQAEETAHTQLGDPAFVDVPIAEITDSEANASLATGGGAGTNAAGALVSGVGPPGAPARGGPDRGPEHGGNTTHLTVTDAEGMMISMTNTITSFWGSQESVGGYFVNDQLTRFDAVGSTDANVAEAGRRSVSWSLPMVLLDDQQRPVLGLGSPGGERIPLLLGNVLTRWALHSQSLDEAVEATRFAFEDGQVLLEDEPPGDVAGELSLSYEVIPAEWAYFGSVQALEVDYEVGTVIGAVDTRREADLVIGTVDE